MGLEKTELTGNIHDLQRQGDYLIMHVAVTDSVKWRIRAKGDIISYHKLPSIAALSPQRRLIKFKAVTNADRESISLNHIQAF